MRRRSRAPSATAAARRMRRRCARGRCAGGPARWLRRGRSRRGRRAAARNRGRHRHRCRSSRSTGAIGHDVPAYRPIRRLTTKAVAMAANPSPRPVRPRPSVVVADTETGASEQIRQDVLCVIAARRDLRLVADHLHHGVDDAKALRFQEVADVAEHGGRRSRLRRGGRRRRIRARCRRARPPTAARRTAHGARHPRRNGRCSRRRRRTTAPTASMVAQARSG